MLTLETVDFSDYDIIHIHGIPHYGILEHLDKIKEKRLTFLEEDLVELMENSGYKNRGTNRFNHQR